MCDPVCIMTFALVFFSPQMSVRGSTNENAWEPWPNKPTNEAQSCSDHQRLAKKSIKGFAKNQEVLSKVFPIMAALFYLSDLCPSKSWIIFALNGRSSSRKLVWGPPRSAMGSLLRDKGPTLITYQVEKETTKFLSSVFTDQLFLCYSRLSICLYTSFVFLSLYTRWYFYGL